VYSDYLRQWVPAYGNLGVTEQRNARHYTDYYGTNWPPMGMWGGEYNPPGMGWNPPGGPWPGWTPGGPRPEQPIYNPGYPSFPIYNPPGQVSPPIYYPPGGIISPPIYNLPNYPANPIVLPGGSNITVPINKFPLTINLGAPWYSGGNLPSQLPVVGGGFGPGQLPSGPQGTPMPMPYYPNPPASWPPPESVARALRR
jgi:hypothetical protein